jgi:hypothetical protein
LTVLAPQTKLAELDRAAGKGLAAAVALLQQLEGAVGEETAAELEEVAEQIITSNASAAGGGGRFNDGTAADEQLRDPMADTHGDASPRRRHDSDNEADADGVAAAAPSSRGRTRSGPEEEEMLDWGDEDTPAPALPDGTKPLFIVTLFAINAISFPPLVAGRDATESEWGGAAAAAAAGQGPLEGPAEPPGARARYVGSAFAVRNSQRSSHLPTLSRRREAASAVSQLRVPRGWVSVHLEMVRGMSYTSAACDVIRRVWQASKALDNARTAVEDANSAVNSALAAMEKVGVTLGGPQLGVLCHARVSLVCGL